MSAVAQGDGVSELEDRRRAEVRQLMIDGIESGSAGVYDAAFRRRLTDRSSSKAR